jgi:hypothetical protein
MGSGELVMITISQPYRAVIGTGSIRNGNPSSLNITIPHEWRKDQELETGNLVFMEVMEDGSLKISKVKK